MAVSLYVLISGGKNCFHVSFINPTHRTRYLYIKMSPPAYYSAMRVAQWKRLPMSALARRSPSALNKQELPQSWAHRDLTCLWLMVGLAQVDLHWRKEIGILVFPILWMGQLARLAALNDALSQWLGRLRMGVWSLVSSWLAVLNFSHALLNACNVLGLQNGYAHDVQLLALNFMR